MDFSNDLVEEMLQRDELENQMQQQENVQEIPEEEDDEEMEDDDDYNEDAPLEFSLGRNGKTRWYATKPPSRKNRIQKTHFPGVNSYAKNCNSPIDCWKLFFDNNLLEEIVHCTNKFILQNRDEAKKDTDEKYTDVAEFKALCALLYMCGMYGDNYIVPSDLWKTDGTGVELFPLTMTYTRFIFLLKSLNFDDIKTRMTRKEVDKLSQVRNMIDLFVHNCQKVFNVSDLVCIKEKYEPFRGKCSFKQYLPNSNKKYGLKIYTALDAIMFYTINFEIDVPNQIEGPYKYDNDAESLVVRLCKPILNDGRTVICDQPYCTPYLAKKLLCYDTYLVGKWSRHDSIVPKQLSSSKNWDNNKKVQVAYTEDITMVAILKKKSTITISTRPEENPNELMTFVNTVTDMVKRVTDTHESISISRTNTRWPMLVFYYILNTAITNSLITSRCNGSEISSRRDFIRDLAMSLCHEHLVSRLICDSVPLAVKTRISKITKSQIPSVALECTSGTRHRCAECPSKKNRKTTNICKQCRKFLCLEHLVKICSSCYEQ